MDLRTGWEQEGLWDLFPWDGEGAQTTVAPEHPQLRHQPGSAPRGREERRAGGDKCSQFSLGARAKPRKPDRSPGGRQGEMETSGNEGFAPAEAAPGTGMDLPTRLTRAGTKQSPGTGPEGTPGWKQGSGQFTGQIKSSGGSKG